MAAVLLLAPCMPRAAAAPSPAANGTPAPAVAPAAPASSTAALSARIAGSRPEDFRATAVNGIYEYRHGAEIIYVTEDGRFAFTGDLFSMADRVNITEARRKELRQKLLAELPESAMVIFAAARPKHTITVFTDVDCVYCRKLHGQIAEYNRLGITVRYLAFPRTGPGTESWTKAQQVWCSSNRQAAMTRAKLGEKVAAARCDDPVAREYSLGQAIGIEGTPGILTSDGDLLPGYVPPDVLLKELQGQQRG
ncbi:MAG: DsbC family protein [Gammaproteobacteria bacterium]|nr:DsbC family protein [Gammaproteobacteria bacterium]